MHNDHTLPDKGSHLVEKHAMLDLVLETGAEQPQQLAYCECIVTSSITKPHYLPRQYLSLKIIIIIIIISSPYLVV